MPVFVGYYNNSSCTLDTSLSLKLRLNLIITSLLLAIMLAGTLLNIVNARKNVRAEVESTEKAGALSF